MVAYDYKYCSSSDAASFVHMVDPIPLTNEDFGGLSCDQTLVLDNEKENNPKASVKSVNGKKGMRDQAKTLAALKNHSEAERRRRERINAHLATLRSFLPSSQKMDKATVLAQVISQVKELKKLAKEATKGLLIPMDNDELTVEQVNNPNGDRFSYFKASLCCEYRPEVLSDIRKAIDSLKLTTVNAEISTLSSRVKIAFIFRSTNNVDGADAQQNLINSINKALKSVMDKDSAFPDYWPRNSITNKRRRIDFV